MKKKIVIIGCGFAGVFASRYLCRFKKDTHVTVIDKKRSFDFLPMLPDITGRNMPTEFLTCQIGHLSQRWGFEFINEEVKSIDGRNNVILTSQKALNYDYLVVASGSETNFYGNDEIKKCAYKIDSVDDVRLLLLALKKDNFDLILIAGGGYTGVEIATSLRVYLKKHGGKKRIIIVERAPLILGPLPEWIKSFVYKNLKELDIEVIHNTVVNKIEAGSVYLSSGEAIDRVLFIWVAGVRTADFLQDLNAEKNPQGRIKVDEYLRLKENCFIAGDCSYVSYKGAFLRMAVQFAICQAIACAHNIISSVKGKRLVKYRPLDLGYIIPMANNNSCGSVMGLKVTGKPATAMHFMMCIYRSLGLKNKLGIIKSLSCRKKV